MGTKHDGEEIFGYEQAVDVILKGLDFMCGDYMLPPVEVIGLLGITENTEKWYLDEKVYMLQKVLIKLYIRAEVSPKDGLLIRPYFSNHPKHTQRQIMLGQAVSYN